MSDVYTLPEEGLMSHQKRVLRRTLNEGHKGLAVFMATGTGKTAVMLRTAVVWFARREIDKLVVIAPNGVHRQWIMEECPKWLEPGTYRCVDGKAKRWTERRTHDINTLEVIAVNVDTFSTSSKWRPFLGIVDDRTMVVIDECTSIKNPKAIRTRNIMKLASAAAYKYVLTGTPLTSGPYDVYEPINFIRSNYFGLSYKLFQLRYGMWAMQRINGRMIQVPINRKTWHAIRECTDYTVANALYGVTLDTYSAIMTQKEFTSPYRRIDELIDILKPCSVFINLDDCIDLPERTFVVRRLEMPDDQRNVYKSMESELIASLPGTLRDDIEAVIDVGAASTRAASYMKLRQITSGYLPINYSMDAEGLEYECEDVEPRFFDAQAKCDQLKVDLEGMDSCIVCCNFTHEALHVFAEVKSWGYDAVLKTGTACEGSIDDFKAGRAKVLVANIRCIAEGYNLQEVCNHMIFMSNTWSLKDRLQVEARIYRLGQSSKCMYIDYVYRDTVDEHVLEVMGAKRELFIKAQEEARDGRWT